VTFSPPSGTVCLYYCKLHSTATTGPMRGSITVQ
jgi:hypothetical protein